MNALLFAVALLAAAPPPMPPPDAKPGLVLTAPESVQAGSGYFKVHSSLGPAAWDVEAQFADPDAAFASEQLDPTTYLIGVPASAGVIRVTVAVSVEGGGPPLFAKCFIQVVAAKPSPAPEPVKAVGKLFAVFVVDRPGTLAESPTLLAALHGLGDERAVLAANGPGVAAQGLTDHVARAGGAPCLILMDADGKVLQAVRTPATETEILNDVKAAHAGD